MLKRNHRKKAYLLTENTDEFSRENMSGVWAISREKKDKKSNRSRQKNKRGDRKVESNEITDRTETSYVPGLPTGREGVTLKSTY